AAPAEIGFSLGPGVVTLDRSDLPGALAYRGAFGQWLAALAPTNGVIEWRFTNARAQARLSLLPTFGNGAGAQNDWTSSNPPANACFRFDLTGTNTELAMDLGCDGTADSLIAGSVVSVVELPPDMLAVIQDPTVNVGRPRIPCFPTVPFEPSNYGTV